MKWKVILLTSCAILVQVVQSAETGATAPHPIAFAKVPASPAKSEIPVSPQPPKTDSLHLVAVEALMSVSPERALPLALKVLAGSGNDDVKSRVLFVISQIDLPEAQAALLETAQNSAGHLRQDAIRMIGIGGDPNALAGLADIYQTGTDADKNSVLGAYLISDDSQAVFDIANKAQNEREFEEAVHVLGAMNATHLLRKLNDGGRYGESLVQAFAIAGDTESLRGMALDAGNPKQQLAAIRGLGIAGEADDTLLEIYRSSENEEIKQAAREGLMMSGNSKAIVLLFHESRDDVEKSTLLRILAQVDDEAVLELIESTLLE